jgi:hypothetical protein
MLLKYFPKVFQMIFKKINILDKKLSLDELVRSMMMDMSLNFHVILGYFHCTMNKNFHSLYFFQELVYNLNKSQLIITY